MAQFLPTGAPKGGPKFTFATPGFDRAAFDASRIGLQNNERQAIFEAHPDEEMHPDVLRHWADLGVRKELFDQGTDGKYAVFTPADLDRSARYALVYVSHGGMEPINRAEINGFAALVGSEQFICVYPWNGGPSNDAVEAEFPRIVEELVQRGYPIDPSRIYAVGYSAGSDATGVLACVYPDVIAAVSPNPGGNLFAKGRWYADPSSYARNLPFKMPVMCVAGSTDGGDKYPLDEADHVANLNIWMESIAKVHTWQPLTLEHSQQLAATSPDATSRSFGFDFNRTFETDIEGMHWGIGDLYDDTAEPAARFVMGFGLPHVMTSVHAPLIWDFLKHFSRDRETGASLYTPTVIGGRQDPRDPAHDVLLTAGSAS